MKYLSILFLMATVSSFAQKEAPLNCSIFKNGIYHSSMDSISHIYIRFTDGDSVFTTSSDIDYDLAAKYVVPENYKYLMTGKYLVNKSDCLVRFRAKNEYGKVKMDGIISDDRLILTVVNKSDNTSKDFIFDFYPDN